MKKFYFILMAAALMAASCTITEQRDESCPAENSTKTVDGNGDPVFTETLAGTLWGQSTGFMRVVVCGGELVERELYCLYVYFMDDAHGIAFYSNDLVFSGYKLKPLWNEMVDFTFKREGTSITMDEFKMSDVRSHYKEGYWTPQYIEFGNIYFKSRADKEKNDLFMISTDGCNTIADLQLIQHDFNFNAMVVDPEEASKDHTKAGGQIPIGYNVTVTEWQDYEEEISVGVSELNNPFVYDRIDYVITEYVK